jgi:hypothetical protein
MNRTSGLPPGVLVDDDVRIWANQYSWRILRIRGTQYVQRHLPLRDGAGGSYLHREVLGLLAGDARQVDHKNGDGLDNRRCNLRIVSHRENQQNRIGLDRQNTTGYRGVTFVKRNGKYMAQFSHRNLGYYDTAEEAAEIAKAFRLKHTASLEVMNK